MPQSLLHTMQLTFVGMSQKCVFHVLDVMHLCTEVAACITCYHGKQYADML